MLQCFLLIYRYGHIEPKRKRIDVALPVWFVMLHQKLTLETFRELREANLNRANVLGANLKSLKEP